MRHNIQGSRTITRRPEDGKDGTQGEQGAFTIQKEWIVDDTHHNTEQVVDFLYVRGDSGATSYWYKKVTLGTNVASTPPQGGVTPYTIGGVTYEKVSWLDTLAVKTFIAEGGNLGGLIFKNNKLISQLGTINGQTSSDFNNPNFVPNILIDGNTGYVEFANAKIRGNIQADEGKLGQLEMMRNGIIKLPPLWSSNLYGKLTNDGLNLIYTSSGSQSITWDIGLGYVAGDIRPDRDGNLIIKSDFSVDIQPLTGKINIGGDSIDNSPIRIGNSIKPIDFNGANLNNINSINVIGGGVATLSPNTNYDISINSSSQPLSGGNGAEIYKISEASNFKFKQGQILYLINIGSFDIKINANAANGNIKNKAGAFTLTSNNFIMLYYYGIYWYAHRDHGQ